MLDSLDSSWESPLPSFVRIEEQVINYNADRALPMIRWILPSASLRTNRAYFIENLGNALQLLLACLAR